MPFYRNSDLKDWTIRMRLIFLAAHHENLTIAISVLALIVSSLSLGWNFYRDVVLKPRLQVRLTWYTESQFPKLSITNRGPGRISLESPAILLPHGFLGRLTKIHDVLEARPFGTDRSPRQKWSGQTLEVGNKVSMLLADDVTNRWCQVGIRDVFGRIHWAASGDLRNVKRAQAHRVG